MFRSLILAVALAAFSPLAQADTLKVPQDHESIQAAVDAAVAGDTVVISAGNYDENVLVPAGKDGLTITGKGKVFINAQGVSDSDGDGDGIRIESHDVTLSKLTIRHAEGAGVRATVGGGDGASFLSGLTIEKVRVINGVGAGLDVQADDCTVTHCVFAGNGVGGGGGNGLRIVGANARVIKTQVLNDGDAGIQITGDDAVVDACTVSAIEDGDGIHISGERATVRKCSVSIIDLIGIHVGEGSGHLVENNRVETTSDHGLCVQGDDSVVQKNGVRSTCSDAVVLYGDGLRVASNTITHVANDSVGVVVFGPSVPADMFQGSAGSVIEKNKVISAQGGGYELELLDSTVSRNLAQACGGENEFGFRIRGDGNTIDRNTAKSGDDTGFLIDHGDHNTLTSNKASGNTDNGIVIFGVSSTGNILDSNIVSNNSGDGIQNAGVGTILRENKIKGNLQDLSNETLGGASYVDEGGNSFSTGGLDAEPAVHVAD